MDEVEPLPEVRAAKLRFTLYQKRPRSTEPIWGWGSGGSSGGGVGADAGDTVLGRCELPLRNLLVLDNH
eukprot:COSAG05_NODE_17329_length_327_cov_0.907895_1_plen_68_part_01